MRAIPQACLAVVVLTCVVAAPAPAEIHPLAAAPAPADAAPGAAAAESAPADTAAPAIPEISPGQAPAAVTGSGQAPAGATEAEALARDYRRTGEAAAVARDRALLLPYGHGHPVVRCAPLRACALELEPGEVVLSTASGDSERWLLQVAAAGAAARTPLVVVKPTACDLSTNLLVATDRRLYEVGLVAPPCHGADTDKFRRMSPGQESPGDQFRRMSAGQESPADLELDYTGITRFYYPDELVRRWAREEAAAQAAATERASGTLPLAVSQLAALNFDYSWERDRRFPWAPAQVFDDGRHTFIVLPAGARSAEAPALFLVQPGGALALLNYRVENGTYIADRVLDHAVLTVAAAGRGRSPYRLEIVNHSRAAR